MPPAQLTAADLDDLSELERRVTAHDGGRLKLEWPTLREGRAVAALAHREGGRLVGFLGLYSFAGPPDVEITGMVDPGHRRAGIAAALFQRGVEICDDKRLSRRLLVVPRGSQGGRALALNRGAGLDHSEHSLQLDAEPRQAPEHPDMSIRPATDVDRADLIRILTAGFGAPHFRMLEILGGEHFKTLVIEQRGAPVGTLRTHLYGREAEVTGFAIDPEHRGRGIGRDVLGRVCKCLRADGATRVSLEVEVANDRALHVYTSVGFKIVSTEDYYLLARPSRPNRPSRLNRPNRPRP